MGKPDRKIQFAILLLAAAGLMFAVLLPFFKPLAWSALFCILVYPLYEKLLAKFHGRFENLASALVTAAILFFMLLPMALMLIFAISEAVKICGSFADNGGLPALLDTVFAYMRKVPVVGKYFKDMDSVMQIPNFAKAVSVVVNWTTTAAKTMSGKLANRIARLVLLFAVVGFSAFFFLRDGRKITAFLRDILPLEEGHKSELFEKVRTTMRAIVFGVLLTSLVQGIIGGIGWYFAGLPNAIFFGFMMFVFGMIPAVGTPVVWGCGVIYLIALQDFGHALFLLAWGAGFVCTVDNFIRPVFITGGTDLNMLVVFLGLLGGLYLWGFVGLFYGPLVLSVGLYLFEIYRQYAVGGNLTKKKD